MIPYLFLVISYKVNDKTEMLFMGYFSLLVMTLVCHALSLSRAACLLFAYLNSNSNHPGLTICLETFL